MNELMCSINWYMYTDNSAALCNVWINAANYEFLLNMTELLLSLWDSLCSCSNMNWETHVAEPRVLTFNLHLDAHWQFSTNSQFCFDLVNTHMVRQQKKNIFWSCQSFSLLRKSDGRLPDKNHISVISRTVVLSKKLIKCMGSNCIPVNLTNS